MKPEKRSVAVCQTGVSKHHPHSWTHNLSARADCCLALRISARSAEWRRREGRWRRRRDRSDSVCFRKIMSVTVFVLSPDTRSERRYDLATTVGKLKVSRSALRARCSAQKSCHSRTGSRS